ncbi:hypothetical protein [Bordetella ansorpii]|nr:hypothetical protein [Bordetella ansorpii]
MKFSDMANTDRNEEGAASATVGTAWLERLTAVAVWALAGFSAWIVLSQSARIFFGSDLYALAASIQDDSFYYIIPAFNFSHGKEMSFGGVLSYGFQPGYELLLSLVGLMTDSIASLLRTSLFLNAVFFAATGVLIMMAVVRACAQQGKTSGRVFLGPAYVCGAIALAVYFANAWNFLNSTTGKENPFAAMLLMLSIYLALGVQASARPGRIFLAGLIAGLLAITRPVPSTLLYLAVFAWAFRGAYKPYITGLALPLLAWLVFAKAYFGVFVPFSAAIKSAAPSLSFSMSAIGQAWNYLLTALQFGSFGPSMVMLPQPNWAAAARDPGTQTILYVTLGAAAAVCLIGTLRSVIRGPRTLAVVPMVIAAFAAGSFLMGLAMALKRPHEMYYASWYFYDAPAISSLVAGIGVYLLWAWLTRLVPAPLSRVVTLLALTAIAFTQVGSLDRYRAFQPYTAADLTDGVGKRWQNTMIAAGLWYKENVPDWQTKTVAAYSAGALGLVLEDRVINLDGLSNNDAAAAQLANRSLPDYLYGARPDFFIDVVLANPTDARVTLRRLHTLDFPAQEGYQISAFDYDGVAPGERNPK